MVDDYYEAQPPEPRDFGEMPPHIRKAWETVPPSHDRRVEYRPCSLRLVDGTTEPCVYVMHAQEYILQWGTWPDWQPWRRGIPLADVAELEESPYRLPAHIADQIYAFGETGMGYTAFTLKFADGTTAKCVAGGAVDFVALPEGKRTADIASVEPHPGGPVAPTYRAGGYAWCLFGRADRMPS